MSEPKKPETTDLYACVEIAPGVWVDMLRPEPEQGAQTFPGVEDLPMQSDWENPITRRG